MTRIRLPIVLFSVALISLLAISCVSKSAGPSEVKDITGTISGTVFGNAGSGIPGVSVTTDVEGWSSTTDTSGHYSIPEVKAGTYALTFSKVGWIDTVIGGVEIARADDVKDIDVILRPVPVDCVVSGLLFGDCSAVDSIAVLMVGDSISDTLSSAMVYSSVMQRYSGIITLPPKGSARTAIVQVFNNVGHLNACLVYSFSMSGLNIVLPTFDARNALPIAEAGSDTIALTNDQYDVTLTGSAAIEFGRIVLWSWDFDGDGTWDYSSATDSSALFSYPPRDSQYTARLKVLDDDGDESIDSISFRMARCHNTMVQIPTGVFAMGDSMTTFIHQVTVSAFSMSENEVTQAEYLRVTGTNPSAYQGSLRLPVDSVSWFDAVIYCMKRSAMEGKESCYDTTVSGRYDWPCDISKNGYRLPTEAEWEYACRAGTTTTFYFPVADTLANMWFSGNCVINQPVGGKVKNSFGLYDMSGNVWEWCGDWSGSYTSAAAVDPLGQSYGSMRVRRGGGINAAMFCRSAYRGGEYPESMYSTVGFRVVYRP